MKFKISWKLVLILPCFISLTHCSNPLGDTLIGGSCSLSNDCVGIPDVSSECRNSMCLCKPGYVRSSFADDCFPLATEVGGDCREPPVCQQGTPGEESDCIENKCVCKEDYVHEPRTDNLCRPKCNEIGEECVRPAQCSAKLGEHAFCNTNGCDCDPSLSVAKNDSTYCLPIRQQIGDQCEDNRQCTRGQIGALGECSPENICDCESDAVHEDGQHICYQKATAVGDECQVNIQCSSNLGELSICSTNTRTCSCLPGAVPSPDNRQCIPQNEKLLIGGTCTSIDQCSGNPMFSVECTASEMCACRVGFVTNIQMNDCLPIVNSLDSYCSESQQCQQGTPGSFSVCKNSPANPSHKVCKCTSDAVNQPGGDKCFQKTQNVESPCEIQEQCIATLGQSQCIDGVCQCLEPAQRSVNGVKCVVERSEM